MKRASNMTDIRILIELEIKVSLVLRTTIIIEILDFKIPLSNCQSKLSQSEVH